MSQYLSVYLKPKKDKGSEPLLFSSACRGSYLYDAFSDYAHDYTNGNVLTLDSCNEVLFKTLQDIKEQKNKKKALLEVLGAVNMFPEIESFSEVTEELWGYDEAIKELELKQNIIEHIKTIVYDCSINYNDFECVVLKIE